MALKANVVIPDKKLNKVVPELRKLAEKHGIKYVKPTPIEDGTLFTFTLKNGEEDKKDAFLDEIKAEWL